jgi:hypothetical protein
MNGSDLLLTAPITPSGALETTSAAKAGSTRSGDVGSVNDKKTEKIAKDFESVLLTKVLEGMENTVSQFSTEEEAGSGQIKGLFTLFLGRDLADNGGLGLWKDLNRFFKDMQKTNAPAQSLDEKL